ncbi:fungal-specific transcription factor domain-containing protein [Xylogone sp. PMI_703]|nr:fungal-specific transcription factor domain-containing protein [Xylogone sp. PMI_703]
MADYFATTTEEHHNEPHRRTFDEEAASNSTIEHQNATKQSYNPASKGSEPLKAEQSSTPPSRIRRRNRMITSCLECRRRKLKCDKSHPCTNCLKFSRDCVFLAPALDQASQLKLTEIKEKVGSLERQLERDVAKSRAAGVLRNDNGDKKTSLDRALPDDFEDDLPPLDDEKDLEPTPLAVQDAAYEIDCDDDDILDLGIRLGKMRMTERIGGFFRPKFAQEVRQYLVEFCNGYILEYALSDTFMTGNNAEELSSIEVSPLPPMETWIRPGPSYVAPASGFLFGPHTVQHSLMEFLPSRVVADKLITQYFTAVHPIAQIVHRPSFEKEYGQFWDDVSLGIEPPTSAQAIMFAAMFSATVSMDESVTLRDFGVSKQSLQDNFKTATESSFGRANFLRTTKIETLQALVMYLISLCRAEVSRAHSVLVGAVIRMAECMGLHRDGETYGLNPLDTHIRRLIWHQICFLDIRTCEAQGPRPSIRRDDFDTKLPLNVDDADLSATGPAPVARDRWTDITLSLVRFEINEMMRTIWIDRPRIERRKISLTAVLSKIETFRRNMAAKYDHMMDEKIPIQRWCKFMKSLLQSRLHVMVLHRYHNSVVSPMPDRLRDIMISQGISMMEATILLENVPDFSPWTWYVGALHQYHVTFLLLMEIYVYPNRADADRIWNCLDYAYECDPSESRIVKARRILSELQRKTSAYQRMRGMRAPVVMEKHIGQQPPRQSDRRVASISPDSVPQSVTTTHSEKTEMPDVVFAGISNGEVLWALPDKASPDTSSEINSNPGQEQSTTLAPQISDDPMTNIDWEVFDAIFPPGQALDDATLAGFHMPSWTQF